MLKEKVAFVTGGAGGLGVGVCRVLAEAGARVVVVDRQAGEVGEYVEADLLSEKSVGAAVEKTRERFGRIDLLVSLVGGFTFGPIVDTDAADLGRMFDLNVRSSFLAARALFPLMREQGYGRVVTVGARPAVQPTAGLGAYAASKAALVNLTQTLAIEGKPHGIHAHVVLPSIIDTAANRKAMPDADAGRWVRPESIGRVVRFLCSADADDVNGAVVPVYGQS